MLRQISFLSIILIGLFLSSCYSEAVNEEDIVRARLEREPGGLIPLLVRSSYSGQLVKQLFQPLMEFDSESLQLVPVLAVGAPEKVILTDGPFKGGVAYTYELRENARWENGTPVLASDYVFTFKNIFNPHLRSSFRPYLGFLKTISIDDKNPRKFTVFIDEQYFMAETILGNIELMPEYFYDPKGLLKSFDFAQLTDDTQQEALKKEEGLKELAASMQESHRAQDFNLISGSGPYRVTEWELGQYVRLEKKEDWWGDQEKGKQFAAIPQAIRYSIIPDPSAAISLLKAGDLDVMPGIPTRQFIELQKDDFCSKNYHWASLPQLSYIFIALNRKNPKLEQLNVRKALAHTLDLDQVIDQSLHGLAKKTIGPFSPESPYYNKQLSPRTLQLDTARHLLKEAGWIDSNGNGIVDKKINGQLVEMTLLLDRSVKYEESESIVLMFRENARKVGIDIQIQSLEFSKLSDRLRSRAFEMTYSQRSYAPGEVDPSGTWYAGKEGAGRNNYSGFGNAESDQLIDEIRKSLDQTERYEKYRKLQELIYRDQPVLFIAVPQRNIAIHRRFEAKPSQRRPGYFPEQFVLKKSD